MSNALAIYNNGGFEIMQRTAQAMVASGYCQDSKDEAQAVVKIMAGSEQGLPPFASMTGINVIQGKPALGANLIASLIKSHPAYNYRVVQHTEEVCKINFYEHGELSGVSEFTAQDAQRAQVKNMNKFPKNMLFARAISNGARWHCPDIFGGAPVYTGEELGADFDEDGYLTGEIVEQPAKPKPAPAKPAGRTSKDNTARYLDGEVVKDDALEFYFLYQANHADNAAPKTVDELRSWYSDYKKQQAAPAPAPAQQPTLVDAPEPAQYD